MIAIPPRIISAWFGPKPEPDAFVIERHCWRLLMPQWSFLHVTSTEGLPLARLLEARGAEPVALSDIARAELVHQHGGIWLDLDITLLRPLDELLDRPFVTFEHPHSAHAHRRWDWRIATAVFGAAAGSAPLPAIAKQAAARLAALPGMPVQACGPDLWTMFSREFDCAGFRLLSSRAFHPVNGWRGPERPQPEDFPGSFGVHRQAGSWR